MLGIYTINDKDLLKSEENLLLHNLNFFIKKSDLIILSDYGHGFFTDKLRKEIYKTKKIFSNERAGQFF